MTTIRITLTVFMFMLSTKGGLCYICSVDDILECFEPLDSIVSTETLNSGYGYGHQALSKESWASFCRIYNSDVRDCLDGTISVCTEYLKDTFQGVEDGLNYMCNEGFQDLMKYSDCLSSNITQAATQNCANQLKNEMYMVSENSKEICSFIDDAFECVADVTEDNCGKEASDWVMKVDRMSLGPLMDYLGCNKMSVGHLVAAVVGSIFGATVLLTCVCCLVAAARRQRRVPNDQATNPAQIQGAQGPAASLPEKVGPPPSYSEVDPGLPPKYI